MKYHRDKFYKLTNIKMAGVEKLNQEENLKKIPVDTDLSRALTMLDSSEWKDEIKYDKDTMKDILIKKYDVKPPLHCNFDHQDEKGNYVFHIYESQETHNATVDWVTVNPYTGEVTTFDWETFNLADYKDAYKEKWEKN